MGINKSTGLFSELFQMMEQEVAISSNKHPEYKKAMLMSPEEKQISYLNRYFIFKKVRSVDARKMAEAIRGQNKIVEQTEEPEQTEQPEPQEEPEQTIVKIRVPKRTNRQLVIKKPKSSN
jgi:folate-binding Fe-S cluster repair protein YgfZ